ncbi:hypothetical protein [Clostridioides sp. GD02404]|uniref:hypothetical protein n=1 Tax=Clostridioides sp. GD02404 TaxID=3054354 RepID=UPI00389B7FD2
MQTLDVYMKKLCPQYLIKHSEIVDEVTVDVRTPTEYGSITKLQHNISVIDEKEYDFLHRNKPIAGIIVLYGLIKNRKNIKNKLLSISDNNSKKIIIACSKGRIRSPVVWMYSRYLKMDSKVLLDGINSLKNNS